MTSQIDVVSNQLTYDANQSTQTRYQLAPALDQWKQKCLRALAVGKFQSTDVVRGRNGSGIFIDF